MTSGIYKKLLKVKKFIQDMCTHYIQQRNHVQNALSASLYNNKERRGEGWGPGKGGEMTQIMYAHVNK
jgi:hypothetical protein